MKKMFIILTLALAFTPTAQAKKKRDCSGYTVTLTAPGGDRPYPGMGKTCSAAKADARGVCKYNPPAKCAAGTYSACQRHANLDGDGCNADFVDAMETESSEETTDDVGAEIDSEEVQGEESLKEDAAKRSEKRWYRICDGVSDRGISDKLFSSLAACQSAARRACSTLDSRKRFDAECHND